MNIRSGEDDKSWFRCNRFLHINDKWYFVTREYTQEGPFDNKDEAQKELFLYLRHEREDVLHARDQLH